MDGKVKSKFVPCPFQFSRPFAMSGKFRCQFIATFEVFSREGLSDLLAYISTNLSNGPATFIISLSIIPVRYSFVDISLALIRPIEVC